MRLTRELAIVDANMRAISKHNTTMQKLLGYMQDQLANSSQNNKDGVSSERKVGMDMVANYATHQTTRKIAIPPNYSRTITSRRLANVFDRLGPARNR